MELSPKLYHWFVRPRWFNRFYMEHTVKPLLEQFDFRGKNILDFGCGVGTSSYLFDPARYIGVDCDDKRVEYAKKIFKNYKFYSLQNDKLPIEENSIDYIMIFAGLHHIPSEDLSSILMEFRRVLKKEGKIIAIEPCLFEHSRFNNEFMNFFDKGEYIRNEYNYLKIFQDHDYQTETVKRFTKGFFYNELLFTAQPKK